MLALRPGYIPGADPLWDRLGTDWRAFDHIAGGARVYVHGRRLTERGNRFIIDGLCISALPITADLLRAIPVGRLEALADSSRPDEAVDLASMEPLRRERGEDGDAFADRVAEWYRAVEGFTPHPAKVIAQYSDVPVTTVHGWIREARLRGKLPPGRRGGT